MTWVLFPARTEIPLVYHVHSTLLLTQSTNHPDHRQLGFYPQGVKLAEREADHSPLLPQTRPPVASGTVSSGG